MGATKVLDSWALMAFFEDDAGAEIVEELLLKAEESGKSLLMCVVNWGEVWYNIARHQGPLVADRFINDIDKMAIEIVDADVELTMLAAKFKAKHAMAYADCYAAALARLRKADLVTGDREFKLVAGDVKILWLR
jgi:predicted nucleic acid-binding protein